MKSKIIDKIMSETPDWLKKEVDEYSDSLVKTDKTISVIFKQLFCLHNWSYIPTQDKFRCTKCYKTKFK